MVTIRTVYDIYSVISYRRDKRLNLPYKFISYDYCGRTTLTDLEKCLISTLVRTYMVTEEKHIKDDAFDSLFGMIYPGSRYQQFWYDEDSWRNELEKAMQINRQGKIRPEEKVIRLIEKFMRTKKRQERKNELIEEKYC